MWEWQPIRSACIFSFVYFGDFFYKMKYTAPENESLKTLDFFCFKLFLGIKETLCKICGIIFFFFDIFGTNWTMNNFEQMHIRLRQLYRILFDQTGVYTGVDIFWPHCSKGKASVRSPIVPEYYMNKTERLFLGL